MGNDDGRAVAQYLVQPFLDLRFGQRIDAGRGLAGIELFLDGGGASSNKAKGKNKKAKKKAAKRKPRVINVAEALTKLTPEQKAALDAAIAQGTSQQIAGLKAAGCNGLM